MDADALVSLTRDLGRVSIEGGRDAVVRALTDSKAVDDPETAADALLSLTAYRTTHNRAAAAVAADLQAELGADATVDLTPLLSARGLVRLAKTHDLAQSYSSTAHTLRLISDLRPVFDDDPSGEPVAVILSHQLEILVWKDGRTSTSYVTLDDADLEELAGHVVRAQAKARTLRELVKQKLSISVYEPGREDQ